MLTGLTSRALPWLALVLLLMPAAAAAGESSQFSNLSVTYGVKGYPKGAVETRERQVGIEVGLNFQQILDDIGVRRDRWWGYVAHLIFDNVRFPFTAGGFRYDLNHKKWHGLDSGNSFGF